MLDEYTITDDGDEAVVVLDLHCVVKAARALIPMKPDLGELEAEKTGNAVVRLQDTGAAAKRSVPCRTA
eukprot:scaffold4423_cov344-Prasinococcus_capsulatus_cf.AAC.6